MSIYKYTDYRTFLKEHVEKKKIHSPTYSFRYLAHKLGCNAGFFNRVVHGTRNLSSEHTIQLGTILKLKKREQQYFELLVQFNQAKKDLEKEHLYQKLKEFPQSTIHQVSKSQYALYENWYNIALRELINIIPLYENTEESYKNLAKHITPTVKATDVKKSLKTLIDLKLISKDETGRYQLNHKLISSGPNLPKFVTQKILKQFFEIGIHALEHIPKEQRVCSTLTVSISKNRYEKIQEKLSQCREEILDMVKKDSEPLEQVYQINIQAFPMTTPLSGDTDG